MAKTTTETEIVITGRDQYTPTADKIEKRVDSFAAKIKRLGQASGSEAFGKLGEVAGKAEEAGGGGFGAAAKVGGALFIGAQIGATMSRLAATFEDVKEQAGGAEATTRDYVAAGLRVVPLLGDFVKGFDDLGDAIAGRDSVGKLTEDAKNANAKVDAARKQRDGALNVIRDVSEENDPRLKIQRDAREEAAMLQDARKKSLISEDEFQTAMGASREAHARKIREIDEKGTQDRVQRAKAAGEEIKRIEAETAGAVLASTVTGLRRQGQELQADYLEIADKFKAERDKIAADRQAVIDNPIDPETDAKRRAAVAARAAASSAAEAEAVAQAKGADAKRKADAAKEATDIIKQQQDEDFARAKANVVQGRGIAAAADGRFQSSLLAARAQVEVLGASDQKRLASDAIAESKKTNELLQRMLNEFQNAPIV